MTNRDIGQPHNAGERLGYHSSARSSTSGDGRDGSNEEGVQSWRMLRLITKPGNKEGFGVTHKNFASLSDYTRVMNGEAGRGIALLGKSGDL